MTKKHFIAFAKHIKQLVELNGPFGKSNLEKAKAIAAAVVAVNDNPNFDQHRFYKACGLDRFMV